MHVLTTNTYFNSDVVMTSSTKCPSLLTKQIMISVFSRKLLSFFHCYMLSNFTALNHIDFW